VCSTACAALPAPDAPQTGLSCLVDGFLMTVLRTLRRCGARWLAPMAAMAALLTACGGGTEQVESFVPARLLVLGDESGVIVDDGTHDGFKYSLNDRITATTNNTGKCLLLPTASQHVAAHYGFVFAECNPDAKDPKAFAKGQVGARTDDPATGLKAQLDGITGLGKTDLVMVQIGVNDVIDLYEQKAAGTLTTAQATAEATRRGGVAAAQVNRLLATGARGLVFTIPEMGKSPFAVSRGADTVKLMNDLSAAFNTALRLGIDATDYDGRNYGLVLADDVVAAIEKFPTSYLVGAANKADAVCALASMPAGCLIVSDTVTPANNIAYNTHLWASDRHLGPVANAQIASQALSRAVNNPF